ncbi:hypothetical protein [Sulfurimonas sp.]|uniref:hypothetical protein n=1 Tax=Sulfurimonas sp. TaxID=2022749 RepID=UPI0025FE204B|nr:hypothetical protein [Sulfurimonas sp.]MBW6487579.1 hypothetical protein [Sulfurimonas sp.]
MKTFFIFLTFLILFTGCSNKNAFFGFEMDKTQELCASSLQSSKIMSKEGEVSGVFSAVYLNEVYPKAFYGEEYFFVFFYTKENRELYDSKNPTDADLMIKLNSELPVKIEKLPQENQFSHLADIKNDWNHYYLIAFKKSGTLNLVLENGNSSSAVLKYKKEE